MQRLPVAVLCLLLTPMLGQAQISRAIERMEEQVRRSRDQMREMNERMQKDREEMNRAMQEAATALGQEGAIQRPGSSPVFASPLSQNDLDSGGLMLPRGDIKHSQGERLKVRDQDGNSVVGKLHVRVGDSNIVMLPDGMLKVFSNTEATPTEDNFVPLDMDAIEERLLQDPRLAGFKTIRSRRFLYVYNTSELFVRSSRTILESMYPAVQKYFKRSKVDVHEPELPLVVIAFATEDQFQEYRRMPRGVVAYYDGISNAVMFYERSALSQHAPEIAVKNAISTIAHEGAHQILHNIGVQQRLSKWPMWLSEGLAEFCAPTSVAKGVKWSGLGSPNELRMFEISKSWESDRSFGSGRVVRDLTNANELSSLDYAYSWGLVHMLSRRHQKELFACIAQCSELKPLDGTDLATTGVVDSDDVFSKHFGDQYSDLEQELKKHLRSLNYVDPVANQTHYLVITGGRVIMTSSPESVKEIQRSSFGKVSIKRFPNRAAAELAMQSLTR
ncbi:DUF1570 domain-containing protein [Rubripirellula amarantea]|nr:DUF1570 domain-containing protein [Rubripirellula amarantea]